MLLHKEQEEEKEISLSVLLMLLVHYKCLILDYTPALNNNLNVDDTGNTFAGVLNGRFKVYIGPYSANAAQNNSM